MIGSYGEQRDDGASHGSGYEMRDGDALAVATAGRRSIGAISKDVFRTFQTTVQKNGRSQQMMPEHAPVSAYVQPGLQKIASGGSRIARSVQKSAIVDNVSSGFSSVNDRLGAMLSRSKSDSYDRGIYSSGSMSSWGSNVSAEISTFTTKKVVPFFRRSNSCPVVPGENGGGQHGAKVVSFDYQLMKDNE